jgi:uracil-DNA glycosylase family 4
VTLDERATQLAELYEDLKDCRRCGLAEGRTNVVFGSGAPDADLVLVGEAPGYHEDLQGEPFVGAAGRFLDELLKDILHLSRDRIYIGNVLKCRPPDNRDPALVEIETCRPFLFRQLEIISPVVVGTMGNFATKTLTGRREGITKLKRKPIRVGAIFVFPIYHPAAALHRGDLYDEVRDDFKALKAFLDAPKPTDDEPPQMELF